MTADHSHYPDSGIIFNDNFGADLRAQFDEPISLEGETLYYLSAALENIRPSTILALAVAADRQERFLSCLKLADMARAYPDRAEVFAGEAVGFFDHDEVGKADTVYRLILRAAMPDEDNWKSLHSITTRMVEAVRKR